MTIFVENQNLSFLQKEFKTRGFPLELTWPTFSFSKQKVIFFKRASLFFFLSFVASINIFVNWRFSKAKVFKQVYHSAYALQVSKQPHLKWTSATVNMFENLLIINCIKKCKIRAWTVSWKKFLSIFSSSREINAESSIFKFIFGAMSFTEKIMIIFFQQKEIFHMIPVMYQF